MFKNRFLGASATAALAFAGLTTAALPAAAAHGGSPDAVSEVIVTPPSNLLNTQDTRQTGHNDFLENGLHVWTEGTGSTDKAAGYLAQDAPLTGFGEPSLVWNPTDPNLPASPGEQIVVDFDNDTAPDGILVGEPAAYGNEWWLSNSAAQFVKNGAPHNGGGYGSPWYGTLVEWAQAFSNAQVQAVGYSLGSGVHGDGIISSMTYGNVHYTFALGVGPCEALDDATTQTATLTQNCSTFGTVNVADGWTVDGDGYTLTAVEDGSHPDFPGPVMQSATGDGNGPAELNVENLDIESQGFENGQNSGGQLAGIKFNRAGGFVHNVTINGISHGNGVQEGIALWVRNRDASGSYFVPAASIDVDHVTVTNYQKGGVILDGNLGFTLTNSTVGSAAGPDGSPLTGIAANAVQISRDAHGTVSDNTIGLNEYDPVPPPGDGSDATSILVYDAKKVTITRNVVTGGDGDVGLDAYNDTQGVLDTNLTVSCNFFSRSESQGDYDPYGVGIAQWDDGSTPVSIALSDTTFSGWDHPTSTISFDNNGDPVFGAGASNQALGACPPSAPSDVSLSGGDQQTDVSWTAASAPAYAPLLGYTVTATDEQQNVVASTQVGPGATTAHLTGLASGQDYTISVVANGGGGDSSAATAVLHATSLTLSPDAGTISYGDHTTLNGTLASTDPNADLGGRQVTIQSAPKGTNTWSDLATKSVAADGTFSLQVTPSQNTDYRAVYAGAPDNSSVSPKTTVDVAMFVKVRASAKKIKLGKKLSITGVVSPNHAGYQVELQVLQGNTWTTVDSQALDEVSSYGFKWKATPKGVRYLRVLAEGDATHVDGTSAVVKVKVHK